MFYTVLLSPLSIEYFLTLDPQLVEHKAADDVLQLVCRPLLWKFDDGDIGHALADADVSWK